MIRKFFSSGFFKDSTGALSQMRLLSFLIVAFCLPLLAGLCIAEVAKGRCDAILETCAGVATVLAIAFGGKTLQSFAEAKSEIAHILPFGNKDGRGEVPSPDAGGTGD